MDPPAAQDVRSVLATLMSWLGHLTMPPGEGSRCSGRSGGHEDTEVATCGNMDDSPPGILVDRGLTPLMIGDNHHNGGETTNIVDGC